MAVAAPKVLLGDGQLAVRAEAELDAASLTFRMGADQILAVRNVVVDLEVSGLQSKRKQM